MKKIKLIPFALRRRVLRDAQPSLSQARAQAALLRTIGSAVSKGVISILFAAALSSCAAKKTNEIPKQPKVMSPATMSELEHGKRLFQDGYYKQAMQQLLPLAAEGNMEAQYAVGYMYYYGFGIPQDTESGFFWIKRSADQNFEPAKNALAIMQKQGSKKVSY